MQNSMFFGSKCLVFKAYTSEKRKFIITYYLNDNSLQIYEPRVRNSGISEGKFLERNQYKTPNG